MLCGDDLVQLVDPVVDFIPSSSLDFVVICSSSVISLLSVEVRVTGAVHRPGASSADVDGGSALFGIVIVFLDHKE